MRLVRAGAAILVLALVVGAVAVVSYHSSVSTVTSTQRFTSTTTATLTITTILDHTTTVSVYVGARLVGNCTVTSYFVPDTIEASSSIITVTSGNSTFSYTTYYQTGPTTYVKAGTGYSTTVYTNDTGTFTFVSTSTGYYSPSSGWTVTACAFG